MRGFRLVPAWVPAPHPMAAARLLGGYSRSRFALRVGRLPATPGTNLGAAHDQKHPNKGARPQPRHFKAVEMCPTLVCVCPTPIHVCPTLVRVCLTPIHVCLTQMNPRQRPHIKAVRYFASRSGSVEIERDHRHTTLKTTSGQIAPPKSGHPHRMPPESGGMPGRSHFWEIQFALMLSSRRARAPPKSSATSGTFNPRFSLVCTRRRRISGGVWYLSREWITPKSWARP